MIKNGSWIGLGKLEVLMRRVRDLGNFICHFTIYIKIKSIRVMVRPKALVVNK